ncbi:MAG: hypothetical protein C4309_11710 [Chloroflexota bacterium]
MKVTHSSVPEVREPARPRRAPVLRVPRTFFYEKIVPAALILIGVVTLLTLIVALLGVAGVIHF